MADSYNLQRFVDAQDSVFAQVLTELRSGRKTSHWMWFIFPQLQGLGDSDMSRKYALSSLAEAEAYLRHSLLGTRLMECTSIVLALTSSSATEIFGADDVKFRSCMTLFAHAKPDNSVFRVALAKFFKGEFDTLTVQRLSAIVDNARHCQ